MMKTKGITLFDQEFFFALKHYIKANSSYSTIMGVFLNILPMTNQSLINRAAKEAVVYCCEKKIPIQWQCQTDCRRL